MKTKPWLDEDDEFLVRSYEEGISAIKVAEIMCRSHQAIRNRAWRLGVRRFTEYGVKDMSQETLTEAARIFSEFGRIQLRYPGPTNRLTRPIKMLKIASGKKRLHILKWLVENVGGNVHTITPSSASVFYIWSINKQSDVEKFLGDINAFN